MTTIETLTKYNEWRRGGGVPQPCPAIIGNAIESAISDLQGWEKKWECAVEMAAQAEAKLALVMDVTTRLNDYVRAGGMIFEPTDSWPDWEMGRGMADAYRIDGSGETFMECLMSVSRDVWRDVSQKKD
jgi:hypothetical protein